MFTLKDRVAVVSGASGSVGIEIVRQLVENGMKVALCTHGERAANRTMERLGDLAQNCFPLGCEMNEPEDMRNKFKWLYEQTGSIDVLVLFHGRSMEYREQNIETLEPEYMDLVVSNHMTGSYNLVREALPYLEKSKAGRVILAANNSARTGGIDDAIGVTVAKGATISLTFSLARRLAPKGITVNCIATGGIANLPGSGRSDDPHFPAAWIKPEEMFFPEQIPMGRIGKPEDVAAAVCYLASEEAGFVTGEILNVSGGLFMG